MFCKTEERRKQVFLPRNTYTTDMHSAAYGLVSPCHLSGRPSHADIASKRLNGPSWFLVQRLPSAYVIRKFGYL